MDRETFRTKVDSWLMGIVAVALTLPLFFILRLPSPQSIILMPTVAGILLFNVVFIVGMAVTCRYTMDDQRLTVRVGWVRWSVPFTDIRSVTATRNPLASPAFSLNRLHIDCYRRRSLMISPKDRAGFLRALHARRPDLALPAD